MFGKEEIRRRDERIVKDMDYIQEVEGRVEEGQVEMGKVMGRVCELELEVERLEEGERVLQGRLKELIQKE